MHVVEITAGTPRITWCDTCLTSAHVTIDMLILGEDGPSVCGTASGCNTCETGMFGPDALLSRQ